MMDGEAMFLMIAASGDTRGSVAKLSVDGLLALDVWLEGRPSEDYPGVVAAVVEREMARRWRTQQRAERERIG